jgi:probable O-glycosylation ligase (exosortase A-associated)
MLRTIFVLALTAVGCVYAFQSPLYALLLYLWVAYFRPESWAWGSLIASLNLSYVAGLLTVGYALLTRQRWRFDLRVALLGLFIAHSLVSAVFGLHPDHSWPVWIDFAKAIVITYLITVLATDVDRLRLILLVIALSLGFEGAKQGWVGLFLHPGGVNVNEVPMLGDNNGVAIGMLMLVPVLTALAATSRMTWERWLLRFLAIGVLYRSISTYSRGGLIACAALGLVYILRSKRRIPTLCGIALAAALIAPVLPDAFWNRMSTIRPPDQIADEAQVADEDKSSLGRLHFWQVATHMAAEYPIFGVGHSAFDLSYDKFDDTDGLFGRGRSVHSVWFGILAELGYPGLLLFLAQLLLAFRACWRAHAAGKRNPQLAALRQYAFAIEAGLIVFVVGGTFLPFQYNEMYWHFIGLSITLNFLALAGAAASAPSPAKVRFEPASFAPLPS